ncbi:HET-domain-containing protein, partial [Thozetella sp. PMI_491]
YLTLSHCWGGGAPIKTTKDNIHMHRAEVRLADLPATFREAVHVTRSLGYRYLWIDSLCIIQDDRSDWEVEAARMDAYYTKSLLTIAAADANDSHAGLFRVRNGKANRPCALQIATANGSLRNVHAYTNNMSFDIKRSSLSSAYLPRQLYSRAWVFQEQALSSRTLTYAKEHISWRCQEAIFDERAPLAKPILDFIAEHKAPSMIVHEFLLDWSDLIRDYTQRDLTYDSDKLIAIRGIADAIASISTRIHYAGIWVESSRSMFLGLLWSSRERRSSPARRLDVAPSWSWASTNGQITWTGHLLCRLEPMFISLDLDSAESSNNGPRKLMVETQLRRALTVHGKSFEMVEWAEELSASALRNPPAVDSLSRRVLNPSKTPVALDERLGSNSVVFFAETATGEVHHQQHRKEVHCLVLVHSGKSSQSFRRVGYSIWNQVDWLNADFPRLVKLKLSIV